MSQKAVALKLSLGLMAAVIATAAAAQAPAAQPGSAYVRDANGKVVRDANGFCILTGYYAPNLATAECDKNLAAPAPAAAKPAPAAPAVARQPSKTLTLKADALFDTNKSDIKPAGKKTIDEAIPQAKKNEVVEIIVEGHADSRGTETYNQALSERRANAVKAYMVSKGVDANKIKSVGFGETRPVGDNKTKAGQAQNRRVDIQFYTVK